MKDLTLDAFNPYKLTGPAQIGFSGGRTSGFMLYHILRAHGGKLPSNVHVTFCNTGKERPETLDFVHRIEVEWGIPIVWLEYYRECIPKYRSEGRREVSEKIRAAKGVSYLPNKAKAEKCFRIVTYETASRKGEPFENLINLKGLPNAVQRFCTADLKINPQKKYMQSLGYTEWDSVVGIRADEPKRVANMRVPHKEPWETVLPLAEAGIVKADVVAFWKSMPFDLNLPVDANNETYQGNCDMCFLKSTAKRVRIAKETPSLVDWWVLQERVSGMTFLSSRKTYEEVLDEADESITDDDLGDCICRD